MDIRFIKKDKIDQKLRSALFKDYYKDHNRMKFWKGEGLSYYGKKYNNNDNCSFIMIFYTNGNYFKSIYLLAEEIDLFCSEYCFLSGESSTSVLTCYPKEQKELFL